MQKLDSTDVAQIVVDVFAELADVDEEITVDSDFFEIGGDSILAARAVARLRQAVGVKVSVRDLFMARTAAGLAEAINARFASARA
jgi:acyl carrier protein